MHIYVATYVVVHACVLILLYCYVCVRRTSGRQGGARIYYCSTILLRLCMAHTSGRQDREMSAVLAAYREMVAREEARAKELRSAY